MCPTAPTPHPQPRSLFVVPIIFFGFNVFFLFFLRYFRKKFCKIGWKFVHPQTKEKLSKPLELHSVLVVLRDEKFLVTAYPC